MISYQQMATEVYKDSPLLSKALSAGKQLDDSLKKEYGSEGATKCHFRMDQYLKYFDYEAIKNKLK